MRSPPGIKWFLLGTQFWCSLSRSSLIKIALLVRMHASNKVLLFCQSYFHTNSVQRCFLVICIGSMHVSNSFRSVCFKLGIHLRARQVLERLVAPKKNTILSGRALKFPPLAILFYLGKLASAIDLGQIFSWVFSKWAYISNTCMLQQVKQPLHGRRS